VKPKRTRLIRKDRPADVAAKLLDLVLVDLAELLPLDFIGPHLGDRRRAKAAENVADAPNAKADGDQAQHHAHDRAADPIGGGFVNTSKHESGLFWSAGPYRPMRA